MARPWRPIDWQRDAPSLVISFESYDELGARYAATLRRLFDVFYRNSLRQPP
jgi:hypothetical protein